MISDGRGRIKKIEGVSIFSTCPRFPTYENSNLYIQGRWRWFLARYQSSKLHVSIFGSLSIFRQSHYRKNLGQASGDFLICRHNLVRSGNCEIPDRLGFSRQMKTRLKIQMHKKILPFLTQFQPTLKDLKKIAFNSKPA